MNDATEKPQKGSLLRGARKGTILRAKDRREIDSDDLEVKDDRTVANSSKPRKRRGIGQNRTTLQVRRSAAEFAKQIAYTKNMKIYEVVDAALEKYAESFSDEEKTILSYRKSHD